MPIVEYEDGMEIDRDETIEAILDKHKRLVELVLTVFSQEELQSFIEDVGAAYCAEIIREWVWDDDDE